MTITTIEFERPAEGGSCTSQAWARVPATPTPEQRLALKERARQLLQQTGTVLVAHYYVDADLQDLAAALRDRIATAELADTSATMRPWLAAVLIVEGSYGTQVITSISSASANLAGLISNRFGAPT